MSGHGDSPFVVIRTGRNRILLVGEVHDRQAHHDAQLEIIRALAAGAPERLAPGGSLFLEIAFDQAGRVIEELKKLPGLGEIRTFKDSLGHERVVTATKAP